MENVSGFLDEDVSISKTSKSFRKTSTATKENMKWNEDAFFNRQNLPEASESLFIPPVESSISALSEVTNVIKDPPKKPVFELNDTKEISLISDGANSSLGIIHVDNLSDFGENSFCDLRNPIKKPASRKLKRYSKVSSEEINSEVKDLNFEKNFPDESKSILESLREEQLEEDNTDASSSSDIEYDGTNIPELNYEFDVLTLGSEKGAYSRTSTMSDGAPSRTSSSFIPKNRGSSFIDSQSMKEELLKCDFSHENTGNTRQSIFENMELSYDSLYQQLTSERNSGITKEKAPHLIKVCPFIDMSSFEVEPILQKHRTSISSDIENARGSKSTSVDFSPEQISARSSSFKSSLKSDLTVSDTSNKGKSTLCISSSHPNFSFLNEDLEDEVVLSGSPSQISQISRMKFGNETLESEGNKDSSGEIKDFNDKTSHSNLFSDFASEEDWHSRLGISESEFFSSEAAKEMLKKDKEAFEKEQMIQTPCTNKVSAVSNWSPPDQHEITAPSWFEGLSPEERQIPNRHISIGTLIRARTENLGSLSGDSNSERPFFGKIVTTPPKDRSSVFSTTSEETDANNSSVQDSTFRRIRASVLSELLDDMSISDPSIFASKLLDKCVTNVKAYNQSSDSTEVSDITNASIKEHSVLPQKLSNSNLEGIEESDTTLIRSASGNSVNNQGLSHTESTPKPFISESRHHIETSLNMSGVSSTCEGESIKTTKSDTSSNGSLPSQQNIPQEFSRCSSSCSNSCSNPMSLQNALSVQYGCMQYLNPGQEHMRCMMPNSLLQQTNCSTQPCPHICAQHMLQPNLLSINAPTTVQAGLPGSSLPLQFSSTHLSYFGIQVPTELRFPEKIALGDSQEMNLTVQNSSNMACTYHLSCVAAYLNDSPLPFEMSGLSFNKTIPNIAGNTTDIKLIIAPRYEGKMEVTLRIDVMSNSTSQALNITPSASVKTKIKYEVVQPFVSLSSKGKNTLNMGSVVEGSTFVEYVTLMNSSEVSVPLIISLSNDSIEDQIYFGLKEMNRQKQSANGAPRFLSPKVMLYRLPGTRNKDMPSQLDIPIVFESIKGKVNSTITAAVETPTLSQVLAFIKILASVGSTKLVLKDPSQNPLILKATKGSTSSHSLTVVNEGTMSVVYDFHIESESDSFLVSPNSVELKPKQSATISVTFTPRTSETVKGKLLAAAEPHGQVFSVTDITGNIQTTAYPIPRNTNRLSSAEPTRDFSGSANSVECNKKYLSWVGVDIGKTVVKSVTVRNPGRETVEIIAYIKDKFQAFQLIDNSGKSIHPYLVTLNYMEEKDISIAFTAKGISSYSGLLCMKGNVHNKTYSLSLCGYGGAAKIKVPSLPDGEGIGYCLEVEMPQKSETLYKNIILQNTGTRAAFVKLLLTNDGVVQNTAQKQASINPSEFVLQENEVRNVLIALNYRDKNQISSSEVILILFGDEILRQGLKRTNKSSTFVLNDPISTVNFTEPYDGEDRVPYDSTVYHPIEESFYKNVKRQMIHIIYIGQNMSFSRRNFTSLSVIQDSFANLTLNTTTASRRLTIESHSPPVKDSSVKSKNRLSLPIPFEDSLLSSTTVAESSSNLVVDGMKNLRLESWVMQPTELILDADNKDNRVLLKSYSNSDMRFKVKCTIDVIIVSPVSGIVPANGEIGLRVTVIHNNQSKLYDNYHGSIKVQCDGMEKTVTVEVHKDKKSSTLSSTVLDLCPRSGFLTDSFLDSTVVECAIPLRIENITSFPKHLEMPKTKIGVLSEKTLVVGNPSENAVNWSIKPISVLLSHPVDDAVDCHSSSFEFTLKDGILKSKETENIVIKFIPKSVAVYTQFFEISLTYDNGTNQSFSIKVQGEAVAEFPSNITEQNCGAQERNIVASKKKIKPEVYTDKEMYEFPTVAPHQKSTLGIIIINNKPQDYVFTIIKPHLPFSLNHSSVTVKHGKFLKIPVHFKPVKPSSCNESEVKFISEKGLELKVKLKGSCSV